MATKEADHLVGYCVCSINDRTAHLISIAVQRNHRKSGVATALLDRLLTHLVERGVDEIWLEVSVNNREAIALYSKSGFEKLNTIPNYYSNGSDALRMHLIITNAAAGFPRETGGNRS